MPEQQTPAKTGLDALSPPPANGASTPEPIGHAPPRPPPAPATQAVPAEPPAETTVQFQVPAPPAAPKPRGPRPRMMTATLGPQNPLGGVPGGQLPIRKALAMAFKSNEDTILVYRVIDGRESVLPHEWPSSYLSACGLNEAGLEQFLVRYVVPDWGGGTYVVRGRDARGETVGEATIDIAGMPKEPASKNGMPPVPPGVDPNAWADAFNKVQTRTAPERRAPTVAEVLKETVESEQVMRAINTFRSADPKTVELEKKVAELQAELAAKNVAPPVLAAVPQESELDKFMKWNQYTATMEAKRAPVGPSPEVQALSAQLKSLTDTVAALASQKTEDEKRRLEDQIKELNAKLDGKTNLGRFEAVKTEIAEIRNIADEISPPATGSGLMDVASKLLEAWTPAAVGAMLTQNAEAQERVIYAKARAKLMERALPAGKPMPKDPPLKRHVPEDLRSALAQAQDAEDLKNQISELILALVNINDEKVTERLRGILNAVQEKNQDDLRLRAAQLIGWIYGQSPESKALSERVAANLILNRESLLEKFGMMDGAEKDDPEEEPEGEGEEGEADEAKEDEAKPKEPEEPAKDTKKPTAKKKGK